VPFSPAQPSGSRVVGIAFVVALHVAIIYALVTVLAHHDVALPPAPIETKIISAPQPETPPPTPPPLPQFATPPPLFVPPPEVNVAAPPPPQSTAPTVTTTIAPSTPAPTAPPARVQPHLDLAHSSQPDYPPEARRLGEQGSLVLQVLVEPDGRVSDSKLVQSSGFPVLDEAALAGVKTNYRFVPGTVGGTPQPMWFTFRFVWKLQ